jgi:hypothetical protein
MYRTLKTIDKELSELRNQNEWLQGLYTDVNIEAVESCINQLSTAQEKFKVCRWISVSKWLSRLTFPRYSLLTTSVAPISS